MKTAKILTIVLILAAAAMARPLPSVQDATGITVVKNSWNKYEYRSGWDNPEFTADSRGVGDSTGTTSSGGTPSSPAPYGSGDESELSTARRSSPHPQWRQSRAGSSRLNHPVFEGYQYHATFKNGGGKTVKSITWNYLFIDPNSGKEVARHTFTSRKKIRPGKQSSLAEISQTPPTPVVSAERPFTEKVVIERIEFSDGSTWERPVEQSGADDGGR